MPLVYDSADDSDNLESLIVPAGTLDWNTTYYWRVRYKTDEDVWSDWSTEISFNSRSIYPLNLSLTLAEREATLAINKRDINSELPEREFGLKLRNE